MDIDRDDLDTGTPTACSDQYLHHVHASPAFHGEGLEDLAVNHESPLKGRTFTEDQEYACAPAPGENLPVKRQRPIGNDAGHNISVTDRLDEARQVGRMKFAIRRDQADHLLVRGSEAGLQRAAISAWARIVNDFDVGGLRG